jgi:branched-chain amino acid aminotransferase
MGTAPTAGSNAASSVAATKARFGSVLSAQMGVAWYRDGAWQEQAVQATGPLPIHPAAHVLHFASTCFEGLKAYRSPAGGIHIFRLDAHLRRLQRSATTLLLPVPDIDRVQQLILDTVRANRQDTPEAPGALYIRPVLFGTEPHIASGSFATAEACLWVLVGPVGDYFASGRPVRLLVDERHARSTERLGSTKTGGNYAASLGLITEARDQHGVDQILFCPAGKVGETNDSSFLLLREGKLLTRELDTTILHSVTRDSLLSVARDLGYEVEERVFSVDEMLVWIQDGEAALAGTAAVLSGVGTMIARDTTYQVSGGEIGAETKRLRAALSDIQRGISADSRGWLRAVD